MNIKLISYISGILLILAIPSGLWPYGYYIFLRWVIFTTSIAIAYGFNKSGLNGWMLVFGAIAFLFNPILPVYLDKSTWVGIDLISAVLFFVASDSIKKKL
ncbi:MAG TPA: DUF6804 family protein [Patescibacteria group bacterium]|nr:DUF6804 family protein [Patescibacteria group bacterium]